MEEDKYPNSLAEIQVDAFFFVRERYLEMCLSRSLKSFVLIRHAGVASPLRAPKWRPEIKTNIRGTQREYSSKPLKHSIVERILVFKR